MSDKSVRPLSPHLQIYRWQWTASYSILHRLTGIALSFGAVLIALWLVTLGTSPDAFAYVHGFMNSWFGIFVLLGFCWSMFFHVLNGIRHLFWDMGMGFTLEHGQFSGHLVGISSLVLTALVIALAL
ncbi:MAG: succinate dehydrogenase, cytochrome b556 subunit [Alphaproteobacteria bacterium]|nr:succinate dehydrogenase, cytochrome b556 subunit [Alphaproteobacteria bacterium]